MARSAEKAMTMLARWRNYQMELEKGKPEKRPYLATECNDLKKADKWRREIIGEISRKVAQIQNAGLGEFRIRDMNDEINKLLREKVHWERQIVALGGPHYRRYGPKMLDSEGREVPGNRGYKYFGAAKDLPGVRELFEREPPPPPRKTRAELSRDIDADYYGYRDDDDGILLPKEKEAEKIAIRKAVDEYRSAKEMRLLNKASGGDTSQTKAGTGDASSDDDIDDGGSDDDIYSRSNLPETAVVDFYPDEDESGMARASAETTAVVGMESRESITSVSGTSGATGGPGQPAYISHVAVPTQQEVEAALVERKKRELLEQYASDTLIQQSEEAKTLLGV